MAPKETLEKWVEAFNNNDADSICELYSDDAINCQIAEKSIVGKENIRQFFKDDFARAKMTCIVVNIFQDGEWAIMEWKDPLGLRGCGFFRIQNEKIVFQRGYWDKLSFLRIHNLPIPRE